MIRVTAEDLDSNNLSFQERLAANIPDLVELRKLSSWSDEDDDLSDMEPLTHNKTTLGPEAEGLSPSP